MAGVNVILKNGTAIEVWGANDAEWQFERLGGTAQQTSLILVVVAKEPNNIRTLAKFIGAEVAGFTIETR